jgi:formylglycine-generating enzyme required for sulfatase activity
MFGPILRHLLHAALICRLLVCGVGRAGEGEGEKPARAVAPFDANQALSHQEAWARRLSTTVETTNAMGLELVLIPPGEFLMGSSAEEIKQGLAEATEFRIGADRRYVATEGPQHRVVITKPFRLSATEITVGQFRRFLESSGYQTDSQRLGGGNTHERKNKKGLPGPDDYVHDPALSYAAPGYPVIDESPATQVSWNDAVAFCDWLSREEKARYRLPTEAEWEYACRAGTTTDYSHGDDLAKLAEYAWYGDEGKGRSSAVGTKRPNPFGLFDMHGSAREWCADWYDATWYKRSPVEDPAGPESGTGRVLRGGKWLNKPPFLRSAFRFDMWPTYRSRYFGFRVVCEVGG